MSTSDPCELLEWDTKFFGFRIGRLRGHRLDEAHLERVRAWCVEHRIDCLYFLANPDDPQTLRSAESAGFQLVDVRLGMKCLLGHGRVEHKHRPDGFDGVIREATERDMPALKEISRKSITRTRFCADMRFPRTLSRELYAVWIEQSCRDSDQMVLVAEEDGHPAGFMACRLDPCGTKGSLGLVGVEEGKWGRGIGSKLARAALDWFVSKNVKTIEVVTQGANPRAVRLYERSGFAMDSLQLWYHWWPVHPPRKE